jgi:hypothetical protein
MVLTTFELRKPKKKSSQVKVANELNGPQVVPKEKFSVLKGKSRSEWG